MSWYFIDPCDVLFFRDSKPFGAGDDHLATSIFPPNPRTVAGAFRSMILGNVDVDWRAFRKGEAEAKSVQDQIGTPSGIIDSVFSMKGPFLAYRDGYSAEIHTRMPFDAFIEPNEAVDHYFGSFSPVETPQFEAGWPGKDLHPLWPPNGLRKDQPKEGYWLGQYQKERYAQGEYFPAKPESLIIQYEPRVGNALDPQVRSAREQHLYQATFVRMLSSFGLLVWLSDDLSDLPESGFLTLGGESKAAKYEKLSTEVEYEFGLSTPSKRFKVVLMTPAFFTGGWMPESGNWSELLGFDAELISVSVGKPLFLGGYDVAHRQQRAIHSFVPPGSVYYFEAKDPIDHLEKPFTESISTNMPLDRLGYGQAFLGHWHWQSSEEEN